MAKTTKLEQARGTCSQCVHWKQPECRRYPPQVVVAEDEDGMTTPVTVFPLTDGDEWCGEHRGAQ